MRKMVFTLTLAFILAVPNGSFAASTAKNQSPGFFAMAGDLIVARPLLMATTIIGSAIFVISSPFAALGGNLDESAEALIQKPAAATFTRCLGCDFSSDYQ